MTIVVIICLYGNVNLESKAIQNQHKTENIQFKCQGRVTLWNGDTAKYTEDTKQNTDLHQQMPAQNPTHGMDRHYSLENDQATTHRK